VPKAPLVRGVRHTCIRSLAQQSRPDPAEAKAIEIGFRANAKLFPGPNTLRVQVALVRETKSSVALDTISTILPVGQVASKLASYVTGKPSFTGQLKIEFELRDAVTREVFGAGIDSRAGGKVLNEDQLSAWSYVNKIMKLYAQAMHYQICLARGDTDCEKPLLK
jgi:hypothetical protein